MRVIISTVLDEFFMKVAVMMGVTALSAVFSFEKVVSFSLTSISKSFMQNN
ncbi:hypothetical protein LCM20_10155 [Halobacillus litoralis]|uniref:hypothetical protein n=1 Tax=Halobacillus litoralis TaxID=45668 RepID=UPI001CD524AC|nr:hypothetical protein [Halobacillus litoralis]MCA0970953.1 hypothetical protein [Halobacillus litoralis]